MGLSARHDLDESLLELLWCEGNPSQPLGRTSCHFCQDECERVRRYGLLQGLLQSPHIAHIADERVTSRTGEGRELDHRTNRGLPTGGFVGFIIKDDMDEIARLARGNERQSAEAHEGAAVPFDDPDRPC